MQVKDSLKTIDQYIEEHLHSPAFNVKALAHKFNITPRQLRRYFQDANLGSPSQYLKEKRLQKAYQHIIEQDCATISEIAYGVGYRDAVYFSQQFKRRFGKYPSEYWFGHRSE